MESLLDRVGLPVCQAQHVGKLSPGSMRRLGVAIARVKDPELLLLDETLLGLAQPERRDLRALLVDIARDRLVLFTSSEPDDLSLTCADMTADGILEQLRRLDKDASTKCSSLTSRRSRLRREAQCAHEDSRR